MKTFKIQPRCAVETDFLPGQTLHTGRKEGERKVLTPTNEKGSQRGIEELLGQVTGSFVSREQAKGSKWRNRSLIDTQNVDTLGRVRMVASDWIGYLDNEIFKVKNEGESQQTLLLQTFDEMCTRLARKIKYWQAYIEQQVDGLASRLLDQKEKLEIAMNELDMIAERSNLDNITAEELENFFGIGPGNCPDKIVLPTLVDANEMLSTFTDLIEGHICKKEVGVDPAMWAMFSTRLEPPLQGSSLSKRDDPSIASSAVMKVNITGSFLNSRHLLNSESQGTHTNIQSSPSNPILTHKYTNSEVQGSRLEKKVSKMIESSKATTKQKSYDANSYRHTTQPGKLQLREISKLAGNMHMSQTQALNIPFSQQQKAYFAQPFLNKTQGLFSMTSNPGNLRQHATTTDVDAYGSVQELIGKQMQGSGRSLRGKVGPSSWAQRLGTPIQHGSFRSPPIQTGLFGEQVVANQLNNSTTSHEPVLTKNQGYTATSPGSRAMSVKRPVTTINELIEELRTDKMPISKQTEQERTQDCKRGGSLGRSQYNLQNHFHKKRPAQLNAEGLRLEEDQQFRNSWIEKGDYKIDGDGSMIEIKEKPQSKRTSPEPKSGRFASPSDPIMLNAWRASPKPIVASTNSPAALVAQATSHPDSENSAWLANQPRQVTVANPGKYSPRLDKLLSFGKRQPPAPSPTPADPQLASMSVDLECHENMEIILPRPITHIEEADDDSED